jgi:hypothetical protein
MWHAFADTRGLRHPSVRPNQLAAPSRRRAPWDVLPPWGKVSRSPTDRLTPWYDGRAEIIPFRYLPVLLGGKGTLHVGCDTGDLPSQEKKTTGIEPHRPAPPRPGWAPDPRRAGGSVLHQPPWSFGFDSQTRGTRGNRRPLRVPEQTRGGQSGGVTDQPQCRGLWYSSRPSARSLIRSPSSPLPFTQSPFPPKCPLHPPPRFRGCK